MTRDVPQILLKDIPWETYKAASLLSAKDVEYIRSYDHQPQERQQSLLDKEGVAYVDVFLTILKNISKEDAVQYVLALIEDMLSVAPERLSLFHALIQKDGPQKVFHPFLRLLSRNDSFTVQKAAHIVSQLFATSKECPQEELSTIMNWVMNNLNNGQTSDAVLTAVTGALMHLLRIPAARATFLQSRGLTLLVALLKSNSMQLTYQTTFCLWVLSYQKEAIPAFAEAQVVPGLVSLLKTIAKEKIVRMSIATLVNLSNKGNYSNEMVQHGMMRTLNTLSYHKWADEDLVDDMRILAEALQANIKELSSFDVYKLEVLSGKLDWTPVHKEESFWKENVTKFEGDDCRVLRVLVSLLKSPTASAKDLAIVCHDLGEFVRFHPRGRQLLQSMEAKGTMLGLMAHQDAEVKKHALVAVQRMLCQHWEALSSLSSSAAK
eukprot:tig00020610_g12060.t1